MKRLLIITLAAAACLLSCRKHTFSWPGGEDPYGEEEFSHEMMIIGERLEDPYTVDNMTKALNSLYPTKAGNIKLEATHYYVRFLPSDENQYDRLVRMGLVLMDHPLDCRVIRDGDYYHDPEVDEDDITWQYAVVGTDFIFPPGIKYEIIDDCYISDVVPGTRSEDGIDWSSVEAESYRLTGNSELLSSGTKSELSGTPHGRITILDEAYDSEPVGVAGVRVACNSFVKIAHTYTDEEGYYEISKNFTSMVRYRLVFKNVKGFGIGFNLILTPASSSTLGKHEPEGYSIDIDSSSERKLFTRCVVNNAGYDYYNSCSKDGSRIKTPPSNLRLWLFQNLNTGSAVMLQQGAYIDSSTIGEYLGEYSFLVKIFLPDITLGLRGLESYSQIYALATHEMAHASHFMQAGKKFWDNYIRYIVKSFVTSGGTTYGTGSGDGSGYCEVGEMWAYYVQTKLYRERYKESTAVFGTSFWFSPQILLYMDDRGLDRFKLFSAFTSDVNDRNSLQTKLVSLYPEEKTVINHAFSRYN